MSAEHTSHLTFDGGPEWLTLSRWVGGVDVTDYTEVGIFRDRDTLLGHVLEGCEREYLVAAWDRDPERLDAEVLGFVSADELVAHPRMRIGAAA